MSATLEARIFPDNETGYFCLVAANGNVLWVDIQARPKANLARDWKRIKAATASAKFKLVKYNEPVEPDQEYPPGE